MENGNELSTGVVERTKKNKCRRPSREQERERLERSGNHASKRSGRGKCVCVCVLEREKVCVRVSVC